MFKLFNFKFIIFIFSVIIVHPSKGWCSRVARAGPLEPNPSPEITSNSTKAPNSISTIAIEPMSIPPIVLKPISIPPIVLKPISIPPNATKSTSSLPIPTKPPSSSPITTKSTTTTPIVTEPITISPIATEPTSSSPVATEPTTTSPIATEPSILPTATKPTSTSINSNFNPTYVYIGLGCLSFVLLWVTILVLVTKNRKGPNSTTPYGSNDTDISTEHPSSHSNQQVSRIHIPCPLPRGAKKPEIMLGRFQDLRRDSSVDQHHYSDVNTRNFAENPYVTIIDEPSEAGNGQIEVYDDCCSGVLYDDCCSAATLYDDCYSGNTNHDRCSEALYHDCFSGRTPQLPQPQKTIFCQLGVSTLGLRRPPRGGTS